MTKRIAFLALLAAGLSVAFAQEEKPAEPRKPVPPAEAPAAAEEEPVRDPFAASDRMQEGSGDRSRFVPSETPAAIPDLSLRGYVEDEEGRAVALLEVEKATHLVRKDDTVSLRRGGQNLVMRVVEMTNLELHVEIGELRRIVVVR